MSEEFCQKIKEYPVQVLIQEIISKGNIDCLIELNHRLEESVKAKDNSNINDLEILAIYYLYFVWMNEETRKDFYGIYNFLWVDLQSIWSNISSNSDYLEDIVFKDDIFIHTLKNIANDITFLYFNGAMGVARSKEESINIYSILNKLIILNYSSVADQLLKILFFGYAKYGKQLFGSEAEFDAFEIYLINRSDIVYYANEDISKESFAISYEKEINELNLI